MVRLAGVGLIGLAGCGHAFPVAATFRGDASANVVADATLKGAFEVKLPTAADPGEMTATVVRPGKSQGLVHGSRSSTWTGCLLNQNYGSMYAGRRQPAGGVPRQAGSGCPRPAGDGGCDPDQQPGGSVTACDIMAEELRQFRAETHKPVIACLMDLATSGAYYIAAESDRIVAHPTALTGGLGVVFNHFNLQDAMAQLNLVSDPVKSGAKIDMGTVTAPLDDETRVPLATDGRRLSRAPPAPDQGTADSDDGSGSAGWSRMAES